MVQLQSHVDAAQFAPHHRSQRGDDEGVIEQAPSLRCYPRDDDEFATDVVAASLTAGLRLDAVRDILRDKYPSVRIAAQAVLAIRPDEGPVWYCYRDGSLMGRGTLPDVPRSPADRAEA
jgi:hypothetical protein